MQKKPGEIMRRTLGEMQRYLYTAQGQHQLSKEELVPVARAYLTSVLLPSTQGTMSSRNEGELRLLAEATDKLLQGDIAGAGDLLMLRFQAVEMAHADQGWRMAKHLLPDRGSHVSCTGRDQRSALVRDESRQLKVQALSKATVVSGGRTGG